MAPAACRYALDLANQVLNAPDGIPRGVPFTLSCCSRHHRDGNQWKDSASFGRDDLPQAIKVADKAHDWIFNQSGQSDTDA